ncbi:methyltransferase domain-containing protein [bacterium]|nr:methyltransferase domain-containing protein [bacterium]
MSENKLSMKELPEVKDYGADSNERLEDWSQIFLWRQKFRKSMGRIDKLPITSSAAQWIIDEVEKSASKKLSVLDFGAGPRLLMEKLSPVIGKIDYESYDIDRRTEQDYYDIKDIKKTFDIVVCLEVIEHLDTRGKIDLVREMTSLTKPGGKVMLTTPNAEHPTVFWRDFSHVAPIHHLDLAGLMARFGLEEIEIHRLAKLTLKKRIQLLFFAPLLKFLHCDFAQSIMAVGTRPNKEEKDA